MVKRFKISEVATMYGVSRPSLLYYDRINLLKPTFVEANGYRFYTFRDMEKLELILTLKESGLSLKEIATFMEKPSIESSILLLHQQQNEISKRIYDLQKLNAVIDKRIHLISEFNNHETYTDVRLHYHKAMTICKVNLTQNNKAAYNSAIKTLKEKLDQSPLSYGSIPSKYGMYINKNNVLNKKYDSYDFVFDYLSHSTDALEVTALPTSQYIKAMHQGTLNTIDITISKMISYINTNGYELLSGGYLIPLVDAWSTISEDDYLTEILMEIK